MQFLTAAKIILVSLTWLLASCSESVKSLNDTVIRTVETGSYSEVLDLFNEVGYTAERWQSGIREVPRIEILRIPPRWQEQAQNIPLSEKKSIFFRLVGSGVLMANDDITAERNRLLEESAGEDIAHNEWLLGLARKYRLAGEDTEALDKEMLDRLLKRVDTVPVSLALAQAAEESGWGTSRFAVKGNSLFGQWDFSGGGIKPRSQRKHLGNYSVAAFDSPQDSINAYMLNLNTHRAYQGLRDKRAEFRAQNKTLTGWELADTLEKYSERGKEYVKGLRSMIKHNNLAETDKAVLWEKGKIVISPK